MNRVCTTKHPLSTPVCVCAVVRVLDVNRLSRVTYQFKGFAIDAHDPGGSDG